MLQVFGARVDEDELCALRPSVESGWLGMGPKVKEFEHVFAERLKSEFVMVNSGTSALHLAVQLLELPAGSDVILPTFTWVGCAQAVMLAGHRPVFADVDLETQNMGAREVEQALTDRTRAIMVVHYAGKPVRLDEMAGFGLPIIEDAAHAVDSKLGRDRCGAMAEIGAFSFGSVKNLATPDGGGIACNDPEVIRRARELRYCGIGQSGLDASGNGQRWWEHEVSYVAPRTLPNDLAASIALVQLQKLEANQRRRHELWDAYGQALSGVEWLRIPTGPASDERHSYFTYLIRVLDGRRDELAQELLQQGVYTTLRFHPLHFSPVFGHQPRLAVAERLSEEGLNLPLHPGMGDEDVERVLDIVLA